MTDPAKSPRDRLNTFVAPRPSPALMRALAPVNRVLCLKGVPGLRDAPLLRRIPGLRGLTDIVTMDLPAAEEGRLKASVGPQRATFITPNHPEFFTDWMLDKEVLSRVAPMAASWATNTVVNGLGKAAQSFWLKNNLIAQIPGAAGASGRAHSVEWALAGHGVLLHPEGNVAWHGDRVAPLFPGAVEMAAEAAARAAMDGRDIRGIVAPVVWKLLFLRDERRALEAEMAYVETKLRLGKPKDGAPLPERILAAYRQLLHRDAAKWEVALHSGTFAQASARLTSALSERLAGRLAGGAGQHPAGGQLLRHAERWLRSDAPSPHKDEVRKLLADMRRLGRFHPDIYPGSTLTQEHVAENIKRLRNDYCRGALKDTMNAFVPRPAGPRRAIIRVPEPIDVTAEIAAGGLQEGAAARLSEELRRRMQASLDAINATIDAEGGSIRYANPFPS